MSSPRAIIQILIVGSQIFGKALLEAGRQAVKNAKHKPADAAGVGHATGSSTTDQLTRTQKLTLDEAHMILNVKRGEPMENVLKNYEHLFKANAPPEPPPTGTRSQAKPIYSSHYLQSKVVRALERIEAETKVAQEDGPSRPADTNEPPS